LDIYLIIVPASIVFGLAVFYYVAKAAVRNGVKEALAQAELHAVNELKKAIQISINAALESREKQTMYEIKKAIYEGVKAATDDQV